MYIDFFKEQYLPEAATLEAELYPEGLAFGLEGLKEEFEMYDISYHSYTVFKNGKLQGYILAYSEKERPSCIYIYPIWLVKISNV